MPPQLSPTCQKIANKINALQNQANILGDQLQHASTPLKPDIAAQIKELTAQILQKSKELSDCIKENPVVPPKPPKSNPCISVAQQIAKLKTALDKEVENAVAPLQKELQKAAPPQKPGIAEMIKQKSSDIRKNSSIAKKIDAKQEEYDKCIQVNGGKLALDAFLKGTATFTTSDGTTPGKSVTVGLHFSDFDRRQITITSMSSISVPIILWRQVMANLILQPTASASPLSCCSNLRTVLPATPPSTSHYTLRHH
jgi:hypothetical protein